MKLFRQNFKCFVIILFLLAFYAQETESVRRVLRGRRTLTRRYFNGLAIPGWSVVLIIGFCELLLGAVLYFVMQRFILLKQMEPANTYAPAPTNEV